MFAYCNNAPQNRTDISGQMSESEADELIASLSDYILAAAAEFGVDPIIIACCIYVEQVYNVNWIDNFDRILSFLDTSIGVGQVRVSTAKMLEDLGYISESVSYTEMIITWNDIQFIYHSRNSIIVSKLSDPQTNIRYVAAYLKYWQDKWSPILDISKRVDILCSLYNLGDNANAPNTSPKPNDFGKNASDVYSHIYSIIYG